MDPKLPPNVGALIEVATVLLERGACGIVWLDEDLVVRNRAGTLVDFVRVDVPLGESILALDGCEDEIAGLRHAPNTFWEVSGIRIVGPGNSGVRLNFQVHWLAATARYLIVVLRTTNQTELEAELESQNRRRALAEAKTVEQARELARVNGELNQFASIISHDLQSPMRALRYHVEDIEAALAGRADDEVQRHIEDLKRQTRRMSRMMTDLLAYARIGRKVEAIEPTDTRSLAEAIVASLPRPAAFSVEITGDWPVGETTAPALDLVLRNLVDNAIKHHDRADGRVVLDAKAGRIGLEISVSDDGPGIAPNHHELVFQPFLKLGEDGPAGGTAGSGIGLSLVRKTAEQVGAILALDSDPAAGRGTTFRLIWPGRFGS